MNMNTFSKSALSGALLAVVAQWSAAGSFSVSPTRIELQPNQRTAVVTLRNADASPLTVQVELVDWAQPAGDDQYTPTREVLATPPVFTLQPNSEQVVRIALRGAQDVAAERAYRIFFQEVPQAATPGFNGLNVALRVGLPIFIAPSQPAEGKLEWSLSEQDGKLRIAATNTGNAHVQVTGFELSMAGVSDRLPVDQMRYVLPGATIAWTVSAPAAKPATLAQAWIVGSSDRGAFDAQAAVEANP
jgi:fimbrial chaperone protein